MFSRVGRLTTFGAHAISNCPFRRDKNCQPQKLTAPINDHLTQFAHSISDSIRPRTTSIGSDPLIGVLNDEQDVIKELELLDLDSWSSGITDKSIMITTTKPEVTSSSSSSQELECPDFDHWTMETDYRCLMRNDDPVTSASAVAEAAVDQIDLLDLQTIDDQNLIVVCGNAQKVSYDLTQNEQTDEEIEEKMIKKEENDDFSSDFIQWNDNITHNFASSRRNEQQTKFEFSVDNVAKMVDWDAWNKYLGTDEMESPLKKETPQKSEMIEEEPENHNSRTTYMDYLSNIPKLETTRPIVSSLMSPSELQQIEKFDEDAYHPNFLPAEPKDHHNEWLESYGKSSGPLVYFPTEEEKPAESPRKMRLRRLRSTASPAFSYAADSERSWTPTSEDPDDHRQQPKFKKRGVVLKPPADEETDRRRALNRQAAVKYREKKRVEKESRKKDFNEALSANRILRQQEHKLSKEIQKMKQKLENAGVL